MVEFGHPRIGWYLDEFPDEVEREREERDIQFGDVDDFVDAGLQRTKMNLKPKGVSRVRQFAAFHPCFRRLPISR